MDQYDYIIIGSGIAGLAAGCYLQINGYKTRIFELNSLPGGMCTAWKRKDYTFEFCIHWLVGSSPPEGFYDHWSELIDMRALEIHDFEEYIRVEDDKGEMLRVFTDVDRLEREMMRVAPEDESQIKTLRAGLPETCRPPDIPFGWMWKASRVRKTGRPKFNMPLTLPMHFFSSSLPTRGHRAGSAMS